MVILYRATNSLLCKLIQEREYSEIDGLVLPIDEEIAPRFLLELVSDRLERDPENSFWWFPRLIVIDRSIIGMISFKNPPDLAGSVEIGYGIVPSQQRQGFATQAVNLLVKEGFSRTEIQTILAYTSVSNLASQKVLEKNQFVKEGTKIDPEDGKVLIWRKIRKSC